MCTVASLNLFSFVIGCCMMYYNKFRFWSSRVPLTALTEGVRTRTASCLAMTPAPSTSTTLDTSTKTRTSFSTRWPTAGFVAATSTTTCRVSLYTGFYDSQNAPVFCLEQELSTFLPPVLFLGSDPQKSGLF